MKKEIMKRAAEIVAACDDCVIAAIEPEGFPRASTISKNKMAGLKNMLFSTSLNSGKVRCLSQNNRASLCYHKDGHNVTLMGTVEILTDPDLKKELWLDWYIHHFPGGITDPNYCILKFTAQKGVLWVDGHYFEFGSENIEG